ncbi:YajG family lipoprotein [Rheinheimera sp.]|uniref:YajG family lipoprotein n=1 Tax=Rheinheimera sp. TaxID=1869214 RepID=UPI0027345AA7|nr:YajG family lipoprotein [Rheinheimera sp.]MDP2714985.1 YajG family lipoprotein [Rheinheimera sp.]
MRYLAMLALVLLAGCSSTRPGFILAPQVFAPQSNQLQQSRFAFTVSDERGLAYTLRIQDGDKVEQIATSNDLTGQLQQNLAQALQEQGANLDAGSDVQVTVKIAQLQALVNQRTLEHTVTNQVALTIQVQHPQGSFSKTYSGDSSFTAPFKMDIAAVERELRVLTEQVITQLLQDNSWHQALRG